MNIFISILIIFLALFTAMPGFGTELPQPVIDYIKLTSPGATIRFDGVVELPDGTMYLPILPFSYANVENPARITMTLPENNSLSAKPDIILFANNLALLKVLKNSEGMKTLSNSPKIPIKVKMGILPQDLVVPEHFVIPPQLQIIIGDLKIAIKDINPNTITASKVSNLKVARVNKDSKSKNVIPVSLVTNELKDLSYKTLYTTKVDSNELSIINPQTGRAVKTINLSSIPSNIALTSDERYILASCISTDSVSIIDVSNNSFITDLKVGQMPGSIAIPRGSDKAYVANRSASSISVLDLNEMKVLKDIQVVGSPEEVIMAEDQKSLFYYDSIAMRVYRVLLKSALEESNQFDPKLNKAEMLLQASNISKLAQTGEYLFVLNRTENSLIVYKLNSGKIIKTIPVGAKPVDLKIIKERNKLYVLSAGTNSIDIIDLNTLNPVGRIELKAEGFYKNLNILSTMDKALITNVDAYQMAFIDLAKEKVIDYIPINTTVNSLLILQTK